MRKTRISKAKLQEKARGMMVQDPKPRAKKPIIIKEKEPVTNPDLPPSIILGTISQYICEWECEMAKGIICCIKHEKDKEGNEKVFPRDCAKWKIQECNVIRSLKWHLLNDKKKKAEKAKTK